MTTGHLTEKGVKEIIADDPSYSLLMKWDLEQQCFLLYLQDSDGVRRVISTWQGRPKNYRNPTFAVDWARDLGFRKICFEDLDL
ncbi:hypothetical protein [Methylophaga nitratireducenticrescens]|uniref:hypothetical protein n=1 Tax=Methylophaga nitratireducenticrescens TaxID=754476 RepID=UPI000CDCDA0F|nr:hypothetical protein [Methylophaga nitratireducenticrescens]AUZ86201.1 hypothetical protein CDW43_16230 [Methylophaga nitratireducenticrescens]